MKLLEKKFWKRIGVFLILKAKEIGIGILVISAIVILVALVLLGAAALIYGLGFIFIVIVPAWIRGYEGNIHEARMITGIIIVLFSAAIFFIVVGTVVICNWIKENWEKAGRIVEEKINKEVK